MTLRENDGPREPPPERVRSTPGPPEPKPASREPAASGPVPVRDLMKPSPPESDTREAEGAPRPVVIEREFEREDGLWIARNAGVGAYGTGRLGTARLVAVHFYHGDDPQVPVREALVPAGRFPHLGAAELGELFERATPIELDR